VPIHTQDTNLPPLFFERQRYLLTLVRELGDNVNNLDFQKLLFLSCQEKGSPSPYSFVPDKLGPFSFTSNADRKKLIEKQYLDNREGYWKLSEAAKKLLTSNLDVTLAHFVKRYGLIRGNPLLADIYRRFPYYAIRSDIASKILLGDRSALKNIKNATPTAVGSGLFTIGYEGRTLESYLNELIRAGITVLCDVRLNPISRKYGFSKKTLSNSCLSVGIRYEHLPDLGIESQYRQKLDHQNDYDALFAIYQTESLPLRMSSLKKINDWLLSGERVALTCFEKLPEQCHRHCVAKKLNLSYKFPTLHL
jgi:uncharacterized protein (DUF488 family)